MAVASAGFDGAAELPYEPEVEAVAAEVLLYAVRRRAHVNEYVVHVRDADVLGGHVAAAVAVGPD